MTPADEYEALTAAAAAWAPTSVGQFEVSGADAHAFVNRICTVDIARVPPGRFAHGLFLRDDATILGRVTVYRFGDVVMLLVDGAQRAELWEFIVQRKRGTVRLRDISESVAAVVVRGPAAAARIGTLLEPVPSQAGDLVTARLAGVDVFAARTTSDGPDGIDLYCRARDLDSLTGALGRLAIPFVSNETWALARLEWGVARVGIEVGTDDTPVEAALEGLVATAKGAPFPGEVALATRQRAGALKRLVGFRVPGASVPPIGAAVHVNDRLVDRVRSAAHSPRFGVIGMTAVPVGADAGGTPLVITADGTSWEGEVVRPPFVAASWGSGPTERGALG
ncbi:MAG: glycine cleavage T C-terminal barrel domain-containing protein [Gemmatimonadales bacterium]|nr:aminomethyltransferase family protein [Gemmatimonadota bacterium]